MSDRSDLLQSLNSWLEGLKAKDPKQIFRDLVASGIINEAGEVLPQDKPEPKVVPSGDDTPRFKLLECRLCGVPFQDHGEHKAGLKILPNCVAAPFVDFRRERI